VQAYVFTGAIPVARRLKNERAERKTVVPAIRATADSFRLQLPPAVLQDEVAMGAHET
jgi:hypothetical protein